MKWWRKIDANTYRLRPGVEVAKCWGTGMWDVYIDGECHRTLRGFPTPAGAMAEAEKLLSDGEKSAKIE